MSILHPYTVEVYVAVDGSEACLSLTPPKAYCAQDGAVRAVKLELEFSRYEVYEDEDERGIPPQGATGIYRGDERIHEDLATHPYLRYRRLNTEYYATVCTDFFQLQKQTLTFLNCRNTRNLWRGAWGWWAE
jgi:hypothetical protein